MSASKFCRPLLLGLAAVLTLSGACAPTEPPVDTRAASLVVGPDTSLIQSGGTAQLTTTITSRAGEVLPGLTVTFKALDTTVATVTETGVVTGSRAGKTKVTAAYGALRDTVIVGVSAGAPAALVKSSEAPTFGAVGSAASIAVKVTDAAGNLVPDALVDFAVTGGGGAVTPAQATTNAAGIATTSFKYGNIAGAQTATATLNGGATTVTFSSTSVAGAAASVTSLTTDPSGIVAGAAYGEIRAKVTDAFGNPRQGATVSFIASAGGGSIAQSSVLTNSSGEAATTFTTGKTVGLNTATAIVTGVTTPASFSTTTIPGAAAKVKVNTPIIALAIGSTANVTVSVADINNNPTTGTLTFESRNTAIAQVSSAGVITGVAEGQTFIVASGPLGVDSMIAVVRPVDAPVLMGDFATFNIPVNTDIVLTVVMDMTGSTEKLGSATVKLEWDPSVLIYRLTAKPTGGPTATINTTGTAAGSLILSIADAAGLTGRVALLNVTLRTSGTAGKAGVIRFSPAEATAAGTFVNLLPKTMAATIPVITR